jgi:RsiW-degrading membrane proteinase PrsW (M82 family)
MFEQMISFLVSWFASPTAWGIVLALAFGAVWLLAYWPPLFRRLWLWAVLVVSAFLTLLAVVFIQLPLVFAVGQLLGQFWSQEALMRSLLLAGIPQILFSGLVQEGSKLVPVVVWWWRAGKNLDPKMGLVIGAVAGAGFGIFEAQWVHNIIFTSGWSWQAVQTGGGLALIAFWERFSTVAFHIAVSALAGYGLARGWGWQFYLIAAFLHALVNYSVLFLQSGILSTVQVEIYISVIALAVAGVALWLRWRKSEAAAAESSEESPP